MANLPARQQKKSQLVRASYLSVGVGALLFLIAIVSTSIVLGIIGLVVGAIAFWASTIFKGA
jgi:hypothetical protein